MLKENQWNSKRQLDLTGAAVSPSIKPKKTIRIEIDDSNDSQQEAAANPGQVSPAFKNNNNFVKAAAKMAPIGNEKVYPRKDNAYMGKQSLSYQEYESNVWQRRIPAKYETQKEWLAYFAMGIFIGGTGFIMDMIEESLVHFKDHFTQHQIEAQNLT